MATLTGYRPSHPHSPATHTSHSSDSLRQSTLKKNMSITQTYYLAHKARAKLSREAAQPDHDLRLLVGHANLLDSLMLELAEAEREQERWFNQSVRDAKAQQQQQNKERHIQWADSIVEEDEYDSDSSSDSDDSLDEDDVEMVNAPVFHPVSVSAKHIDEDMGEDDLEDDYAHLELVRTPSHSSSPPELVDPDSESSDDESAMPPSPPQPNMGFSEQEVRQQSEEDGDDESDQEETKPFYKDGFYLPPRSPARLVSAITVY
jgi:hypothetical protein